MNLVKTTVYLTTLFLVGCGESTGDSGTSGQAGSLASMTVANNRLHILNNGAIVSFDLSGKMLLRVSVKSEDYIWDAETLFNYQNEYLLVGTNNNIHVYSLNSDIEELTPVNRISSFSHLTARDPVIASNGIAYFTTRDGDESQSTAGDNLGVLDISDINAPTELFLDNSLKEPYGLTILNQDLFVCDKAAGLIRFSIDKDEQGQVSELTYVASYSIYPCNDAVAKGDTLILVDPQSIIQVRVNELELEPISKIDLFY